MNYILLADGFEEIEAISVIDILRRAEIDLKVVSINDSLKVTSDRGLVVQGDMLIDDIEKENIESIILPGGSGHKNLEKSKKVTDLLTYAYSENLYIFAICASPSILGKLGWLNGKNATCYRGFEKHLKGAKHTGEDVTVDGKIITSKGPGTAHKFAYEIVSTLKDKKLADTLKDAMIF